MKWPFGTWASGLANVASERVNELPGAAVSAMVPGELTPALKQQLFRKLVASDASECPICMDMAQDGVVSECGHGPFCRECMNTLLNNAVWRFFKASAQGHLN